MPIFHGTYASKAWAAGVVRLVGFDLSRSFTADSEFKTCTLLPTLLKPLIRWCLLSVAFVLVGYSIFNCFTDTLVGFWEGEEVKADSHSSMFNWMWKSWLSLQAWEVPVEPSSSQWLPGGCMGDSGATMHPGVGAFAAPVLSVCHPHFRWLSSYPLLFFPFILP